MSEVQTATENETTKTVSGNSTFLPKPYETPHVRRQLDDLIKEVAEVVAPVWPLKDYVAVNPYAGVANRPFAEARDFLQLFSDCETLMPLEHFAKEFANQKFSAEDINAALAELGMDASEAAGILHSLQSAGVGKTMFNNDATNSHRVLSTIAEEVDRVSEISWSQTIVDEISRHCAAHYDEGQSTWTSPWKHLPLFQAWRSMASIDCNVEVMGMSHFRQFVSELPHTADAAIVYLLNRANIPEPLWSPVLLCQAFSIPGWSAWTKYQSAWNGEATDRDDDFAALLAMRLAYDVALGEAFSLSIDWAGICSNSSASFRKPKDAASDDSTTRLVLLRAGEIAYRNSLLDSIQIDATSADHQDEQALATDAEQKLAQMVFCIDVRSERIRRNLESQSNRIETFGFAGFFGMPIEFVTLGQDSGDAHLPVLLKPQFKLHEGLHESGGGCKSKVVEIRNNKRTWRSLWKNFQTSAVGCFSFVESLGLLYGWKLFASSLGLDSASGQPRFDGLSKQSQALAGPTLGGLSAQGIELSQQADLAESMLRNLGLTENFAKLVVFCGHASQTTNNPLAAGLDCGACGGHSGEPNARMAAMLLNQTNIRKTLAQRGINIPDTTHFVGGLHNTTTDNIELFDLHDVPASHAADVDALQGLAGAASQQTQLERLPVVDSDNISDLQRRAADWSEVRPEWGLAGNAAFVVGPRSMTQNANLDGRTFLHSYDQKNDPEGNVLESIMTAPMVVANWINMQYYASTVDNHHFGSGNKTIHNVVGKFGVLAGSGGDLMTGLPWQSLHTGDEFQHLPMRLQVVIAASRDSISQVIEKHLSVANLINNDWLHLVAIDDGQSWRYKDGQWQHIESASAELAVA